MAPGPDHPLARTRPEAGGLPARAVFPLDTAVQPPVLVRPAGGLGRLRHHHAVLNPVVNPRQERHELVLDVDDLAVGFVPDDGPPLLPIGHVAASCVLGAACGLALWFGVIASIREMQDAKRIMGNLRLEREAIKAAWPGAMWTPWNLKQARTCAAMMEQNKVEMGEQVTRGIFSGGVITLASSFEIMGYLAQTNLFGALSSSFAAASAPLLSIGVPLIGVFAGANACLQFARWHRAWRDRPFADALAPQNPWPVEQFDAQAFAHARLTLIQRQALGSALGFTAIAVGAPLTFFGGPYGLALLIPGVLTVAVANHFESEKIEHTNPLPLEQSLALVTERQICNMMGLAYLEYRNLKELKAQRRYRYLLGSHRGAILRSLSAPLRFARCLVSTPHNNEETSLQTLYRYFGARLQLLRQYWAHEIDVYDKNIAMGDTELRGLADMATTEARRIDAEWENWCREAESLEALSPAVTVTRLCATLAELDLLTAFIISVGDERRLRQALSVFGASTTEITPATLVESIVLAGEVDPDILEALFAVAETLFLTKLKNWRHSRAREMADLGIERKRVKAAIKVTEDPSAMGAGLRPQLPAQAPVRQPHRGLARLLRRAYLRARRPQGRPVSL